ncbi:MAG: peptide deformylase [Rhodospirillales bacterium]|nr:peptide deformylase [Rhodospirillales bacterium]MBT4039249.1 peptide deformylase [Rhodospirillales bacterium]MBT4626923.1 peptide deformylase [Rhodospirillales bacterium]MBT5352485.1 peptide deformylase [Rhodospirillales bacterium]MBT5521100.1 peptide deformylase [Rhodospirillales bacterium]
MARLPIIVAPDPRLKGIAEPVGAVDAQVQALMDDLLETMYDASGIGLAAPQVGVLKRVIVVDVSRGEDRAPMALVNPEIVWESEETNVHEEGCLSLPEYYAEVVRPDQVRIQYLDREGQAQEIEADNILATCIQHEIDHLDGILFVDHVSSLKRNMILRKLTKAKRQGVLETA